MEQLLRCTVYPMLRVYGSTVRFRWPIAVVSFVGSLTFYVWSGRGDRLDNLAQTAAYLSLFLFNIGTVLLASSIVQRVWKLWQKPPTIGRDELLAAVRQEVTERSQQSLHHAVLNNLMFDKHPGEKMPRLWDVEIKTGQKPSRKLNPTEKIIDAFPETSHLGRFLMLGMQGSGKTTSLLELASDLCDRAEGNSNLPMPILLDLPNWQPAQGLPNWILSEIKAKYGVIKELSQQWLQGGQLFLLLDGLDELKRSEQETCVAALNELKLSDGRSQPLVVCTRMNSYKQISKSLKVSAAIALKPLTTEQVQNYLLASRSREIWENIKYDAGLIAVAKNPLLLNLMTLAHEEILIHAWKRLTATKDRIEYLLNAYIRSQMGRQVTSKWYRAGKEPTPEQTKHWLKWLAHTMTQQHHTEFSLENLPYPPLEYAGHFICLGIVLTLVTVYTIFFVKFYTLNIGLIYVIFFLASAWGFVALMAIKNRIFQIKTNSPKILVILAINTIILFGLGVLSFHLNSLLINQANGQTGALLYGLSIVIFTVAIAPVLGLIATIYAALPWMKHLNLRLTLWRDGDIPWNYGIFLEFLTERLFMQKVLGRYRFIHPLFYRHLLNVDR